MRNKHTVDFPLPVAPMTLLAGGKVGRGVRDGASGGTQNLHDCYFRSTRLLGRGRVRVGASSPSDVWGSCDWISVGSRRYWWWRVKARMYRGVKTVSRVQGTWGHKR